MMSARILIVDDEPQIIRFLRPALSAAGFETIVAERGSEALKMAASHSPDLVLLDLGLPDIDGKEVITQLRSWSSVPVIVLSARDRETEKIAALDLGADDYINKPFGIGELMARIRTALRHAARDQKHDANIIAGLLEINIPAHTATLGGKPIKLTPREFELLALLARNAGLVMTHRQVLTKVWGPAHTEDLQYLRVFIGQLRQKLKPSADAPELIQTEQGIGYRLVVES
ncbi:MAG: response regulator transcription factor [Hyphomicrobium sp.]|nr:response regulator transcription factor [Hyphomicrobium sp.]